jgi:hypothetical protein
VAKNASSIGVCLQRFPFGATITGMRRLSASLLILGVGFTGIACTGDVGGGSRGRGGSTGPGTGGVATGNGGSATGTAGVAGASSIGGSAAGSSGGAAVGSGGAAGTSAPGGAGGAGAGGAGGSSGPAGRGGATGTAGSGASGRGGNGTAGTTGTAGRGGSSGAAGASGGGASGRGGVTGSAGTSGSGGASAGGTLFDYPEPWTTDVSGYPKASMSDAIINGLIDAGGWGQGNQFLTDDSFVILNDDGSAPLRTFTRTGDFYSPDCDFIPFPVPATGSVEGESGYACTGDGDCHLIVVQRAQKKLFEMWRANITGSSVAQFQGGCAVLWDLSKQYGSTLRGQSCTSADAGGFPIAAMLPTSDEVASGRVGHAMRFILPNDRIRAGIYVSPGTHSTESTSGGPNTPPYGVRLRLKASFDTSSMSAGAKVLAQELKTYGMFLADGGQIAITIASDKYSTAKWSALGITNNRSLASIGVADFEVVDYGTEVDYRVHDSCVRNP